MGKTINLIEQKFFNEFKNGVGFSDNPNDFTRNLTGSILEKIKMTCKISIEWLIENSSENNDPNNFTWNVSMQGNTLVVLSDDNDFTSEGFSIGQLVNARVFALTNTLNANGNITIIQKNRIEIDMGSALPDPDDVFSIQIIGLEPLTALIYDYGLIENDENYNNISKVTENSMSFYAGEIGVEVSGSRDTSFVEMQKKGQYFDFVTGFARVRFVEIISGAGSVAQIFEIEHEFIINPFYLEEQKDSFLISEPPDYLNGDSALKYVFNASFREVINNPNISYSYNQSELLGSTAWFNESFNGFNNNYNILSINYKDNNTGSNSDGVLISGETKIIIEVSKVGSSFVSGDRFGFYSFLLENEENYKGVETTNMVENFLYDRSLGLANGSSFVGSDYIKTLTGSVSGGNLTIIAVVEFTSSQKKKISDLNQIGEDYFFIGVQLGDNSLSSGNSDRVILTADVSTFDQSPDIDGLVEVENMRIYPHNQNILTGEGFSDYFGWNEDGVVVSFDFKLNRLKNAFLNALELKLISFNTNTNQYFDLDSIPIDLNSIELNGVQQILINENRGYNLVGSDQFNIVEVKNKSNDANFSIYSVLFAQKIKWQEWIENLNVPNSFFDILKPNNNRNFKSSNYSENQNFEIRFAALLNVFGKNELGVSGDTDYLLMSPKILINDYTLSGIDPNIWTTEIKTFRASNNEDLFGAILNDEDTLMVSTSTRSGSPVNNLSELWAIHRIEETNQEGDDIDELSSINGFPNSNRLKPIDGESNLKIEAVLGKLVCTCIIKSDSLDPSKEYNLTARIGDGGAVQVIGKLTSPDNETKNTSGTVEPKTESE